MSVMEALCRTIIETTFETLPDEAVEVAKQVILDGIAVSVAGMTEADPCIMAEHVQSLGGHAVASVPGMGFKTSEG